MPQARGRLSRLRRAGWACARPLNADVRCHLRVRVLAVSFGILSVAALLTLVLMLYSANWEISLGHIGFMCWALLPYVVLALLIRSFGTRSRASRIASIVASASSLGVAAFFYFDAIFVNVSSTSALVFLTGPLTLAVFAALVFGIITVIGNMLLRS